MTDEIQIIAETEAERLAYDGLEDLCAVWRIRAASKLTTVAVEQPFELSRRTVKPKVSPRCVRRSVAKPAALSLFQRAARAVENMTISLKAALA